MRQTLDVAGGLKLTMDIVSYDPPRAAETRFETNGVKVESAYRLEPTGAGTRLTQTLEAKAGGLTGRMLIPVVQGRLEKKLTEDLERLRGCSRADSFAAAGKPRGMALVMHPLLRCSPRPRRHRTTSRPRRRRCGAIPSTSAPGAELAGQVDADALRDRIRSSGASPMYVAVLPGDAAASPEEALTALHDAVGLRGDLRRRRGPQLPCRVGSVPRRR